MVEKKKTVKTSIASRRQLKASTPLPEDGLGARVEMKRTARGLTHDGLSDLTKIVDQEGRGISRTSIRGYELGTYRPGARELRILSIALEASPNWLLLGIEEGANPTVPNLARNQDPTKARWADFVMPLLAFSQLATMERKQLRELIETMYRLQIGEVKFRGTKAFVNDFVDTVQDVIRDAKEQGGLSPEFMRAVLVDTATEMRKKHGDEEANVLLATIDLLLAAAKDLSQPPK